MNIYFAAVDYINALFGRSWAYDRSNDLFAEIDRRRDALATKQYPLHLAGAVRLDCLLAFQPGLVDEVAGIDDSALYIRALREAAEAAGHTRLTDQLRKVETALAEAVHQLCNAADATLPAAAPAAVSGE